LKALFEKARDGLFVHPGPDCGLKASDRFVLRGNDQLLFERHARLCLCLGARGILEFPGWVQGDFAYVGFPGVPKLARKRREKSRGILEAVKVYRFYTHLIFVFRGFGFVVPGFIAGEGATVSQHRRLAPLMMMPVFCVFMQGGVQGNARAHNATGDASS
jgi:hypothetical protein